MTNRMSKQTIFDKVSVHLMTQMSRAGRVDQFGDFYCLYLAPDGKKCAVGCLMEQKHYNASGPSPVTVDGLPTEALPFAVRHQKPFLKELQRIHDSNHPAKWLRLLQDLALAHNLKTTTLEDAVSVV